MTTVCLAVMMRDEEGIILELLESVKDVVDEYVFLDTGSTDNTIQVVTDFLSQQDKPFEINESEWVDFGTNRTQLMELAKGHCDYIFVMDADDVLVGTPDFSNLTADCYCLKLFNGIEWWRHQLFKDGFPWHYRGVVHEYPHSVVPFTKEDLEGDYHIHAQSRGSRMMSGEKSKRDIEALEKALAAGEGDTDRYLFYLAQAYADDGQLEKAVEAFQKRIDHGGWDEESFYSRYRQALCRQALGDFRWVDTMLGAWDFRPTRIEPLHDLCRHYRMAGLYEAAYMFGSAALRIPMPKDYLFVDTDVWKWKIQDEMSMCAFYTNRYDESGELLGYLVVNAPADQQERIHKHIAVLDNAQSAVLPQEKE